MTYLCKEKLWRTAKGEIVHDGDPRAWVLFAIPGMVLDEAPKVLPWPDKGTTSSSDSIRGAKNAKGAKARKPAENKAIWPDEDK